MRTEKIQSGPNFGYNHQLNKKVVHAIESQTENQVFYGQLLKLLNVTNETEDLIRKAEKNKQKNLMAHLSDAFLAIKSNLVAAIDSYFPELNYAEKELKTYQNEIKRRKIKDPNHWLNDTVFEMSTFSKEEYEKVSDELANEFGDLTEKTSENLSEKAKEVNEMMARMEYKPQGFELEGFKSLGGMEKIKQDFTDDIISLIKDPETAKRIYDDYGIEIPKTILLYGPPGCGKTAIVERLSVEAGVPLYKVDMGNAGDRYIHGAGINLSDIFKFAENKATPEKPVIIMLDEADAILAARSDFTHEHRAEEMGILLTRIQDAGKKNVIIISATNRLDSIDKAAKDRQEEIYYIGLPDKETRKSVINVILNQKRKGREILKDPEFVDKLIDLTQGYSNRSIVMMLKKGLKKARKDGERFAELKDFEKALAESSEKKINEVEYQSNAQRPRAGFI